MKIHLLIAIYVNSLFVNYQSLNGTWKNGKGETIKAHNDQLKFSNFNLSDTTVAGTITKLIMHAPSFPADQYNKALKAYTVSGQTYLLGGFTGADHYGGAQYMVLFMPRGDNRDLQNGNSNRDRIVVSGTQNGLSTMPSNSVYYRVSR